MSSADENVTNEISANLHPTEQRLHSVLPVPVKLNRDRLMFEAGAASVQAELRTAIPWYWPAATFISSTVAAGLMLFLLFRSSAERVEYVERPAQQPFAALAKVSETDSFASMSLDQNSLFHLRKIALNDGWESSMFGTGDADRERNSPSIPLHNSQRELLEESLRSVSPAS